MHTTLKITSWGRVASLQYRHKITRTGAYFERSGVVDFYGFRNLSQSELIRENWGRLFFDVTDLDMQIQWSNMPAEAFYYYCGIRLLTMKQRNLCSKLVPVCVRWGVNNGAMSKQRCCSRNVDKRELDLH